MAKDEPDQPQILSLFGRLPQPPAQNDSRTADQLAVLLAIRHFNHRQFDATCDALAAHLSLSIDRTISATHLLARKGYVEAFATSVDIDGRSRPAIAFRIPSDERARHFLERGA